MGSAGMHSLDVLAILCSIDREAPFRELAWASDLEESVPAKNACRQLNCCNLRGIWVFERSHGPLCESDAAIVPRGIAKGSDACPLECQQPERSPPGSGSRLDDIGNCKRCESQGEDNRQPALAVRKTNCQHDKNDREDQPHSCFEQVADGEQPQQSFVGQVKAFPAAQVPAPWWPNCWRRWRETDLYRVGSPTRNRLEMAWHA